MTPKADIQQFLNLIARHGAIIEAAYHDGSVVMTDDNTSAVRDLHTARVLSAREAGEYGLTRVMREMLDENMQRQQRYAIGGNIGDEINRHDKLLHELEEAASQGKHEEIEAYTSDLSQSLYDIRELITQDLLQFDQIMSAKFSDVRTIEEKMRQNKHYLDRTKRLQDALEQINRQELHERYSSPLVAETGRVYRRAISSSISDWSATLLSNSKVFEQFMFSFRNIAEETRRMRAFNRFLKDGGQSRLLDALNKHELPPVLRRVQPGPTEVWPDVMSEHGAHVIGAIVRGLKPIERRKSEERQPGQRSDNNTQVAIEEAQSPEDIALGAFLSQVQDADGWQSASQWICQTPEISPSIFLEHVLSWAETERDDMHRVRYIEVSSQTPHHANIAIGDIEICRAS